MLQRSVKKAVTVGLGLIMTVFTGLMTIQGMAGASADNVSSKAIRFAASSFIPIIGSSVSSLGVIRTSVGSIGIIVLFIIILRPLISVIAVKFAIFLAKCVNEIFGQSKVSAELLKSVNSVLVYSYEHTHSLCGHLYGCNLNNDDDSIQSRRVNGNDK